MATAAKAAANGKEVKATKNLDPLDVREVSLSIKGISPLIQHQWNEKSKIMMREKHAGKKTKNRDVRDPQKEGEQAAYRTDEGFYGIPLLALKSAIITAAHRDTGIEKTLVRKAVFIPSKDSRGILPMTCEEPVIQEDTVRVGSGAADLRYRPYFYAWSCRVTFQLDFNLLQTDDLITLVDRAGFGIGIGEWRPEKDGEFGRFEFDRDQPVEERKL